MPLEQEIQNSLIHKEKEKKNKVRKAPLSQEVPQSPFLSGSLTIEAALVLPLLLFVFVGILFFFQVLKVTQMTSGALAAAGSQLSLEKEVSMAKAVGYFYKELWEKDVTLSVLVGGKAGIDWSKSSLEEDTVDLQICYKCRFPIQLFGLKSIPVSQRVCMKKWSGYDIEKENQINEETWVYITPNGEAYHYSKNCSHLQLSVETIKKSNISETGYTACLLCGEEAGEAPYYYVTKEGTKYHTRLDCSGLKRTIYMVRISKIGERTMCSRCKGG